MPHEGELLEKLERWISLQPGPITLADVLETSDGELFAAYILKGFRIAARDAVLDRLEREAGHADTDAPVPNGATVMRAFEVVVRAWMLTDQESLVLLGLEQPEQYQALALASRFEVPVEVLERVAILFDIFKAINVLLPEASAADAWVRKPNNGSRFRGMSALTVMMTDGLKGLRDVRAVLQAEIWAR